MKRFTFLEKLVLMLLLCFDMASAAAQKLPGDAAKLLPVFDNEITTYWPDLSSRSWLAAIPDQESNWKPKAALKTHREFGCGLGQFTVAYDSKGNVRFDALSETRRLDKSLANWSWEDCYNAQYQLRAIVLKMKVNHRSCSAVMDGDRNIKACAGATNNGGFGSVTKRIRLCRGQPGCDPGEWYGHLNQQCAQSNVKVKGYGESFCMINSKYPSRVEARQYKFLPFWPKERLLSEQAKK